MDKAKESHLKLKQKSFTLLEKEEEIDLVKTIGQFPDALLICQNQHDPFALVNYLQELAGAFHKFYNQHRVIDEANKALSEERLGLIEAARIVLGNGLRLLGVTAPKKM